MAFVTQRAARLNAGVIELGRLSDDNRTGADDEDGTPGHSGSHWAIRRVIPLPHDQPATLVADPIEPADGLARLGVR